MNHNTLEKITKETKTPAVASVIWLHGLGADGHDFADIVPQLNLPENLPIRFVFPHAPVRSITINGNMRMRAWYDIYNLSSLDKEDETGILQSEKLVHSLIAEEIANGIPSQRIILAGFSQGGAVALFTGLRYAQPLGGIMALSTYLPLAQQAQAFNPANQHTPIFIAHGRFDPVLPFVAGEKSEQFLKKLNYAVEWHEYPMEHQVCYEEINDISRWLIKILS